MLLFLVFQKILNKNNLSHSDSPVFSQMQPNFKKLWRLTQTVYTEYSLEVRFWSVMLDSCFIQIIVSST